MKKKHELLLQYCVGVVIICVIVFYLTYTPTVRVFGPENGDKLFILGSVHGNEPSGTLATYRLIDYLQANPTKIKQRITIMPLPNPLGYYIGSRYQMKPFHSDINRNFGEVGKDRVSEIILTYVRDSDFIVDLHEGYEYHTRYPKSMGSSIIPNKSSLAQRVSNDILPLVNNMITSADKKFGISDFYSREDCYLPDSLGCYCNKQGLHYISIETTGLLNNQQPIDIRVNQHYTLLRGIMTTL